MYHLTTDKRVDRIIGQGLKPQRGQISRKFKEREEVVWLFGSLQETRRAMASWFSDYIGQDELAVILEVDVRGLEVRPSWRKPEWWVSEERIPPSRLDIEWIEDPGDSSWAMW